MEIFRVQLWPDGKWDQKPYRKVEAATAKEAAEMLYGRPLQEGGPNSRIRAQVRSPIYPTSTPTIFYENDQADFG